MAFNDDNKVWDLQLTIRMKSQLVKRLVKHKIHSTINLKSSKIQLLPVTAQRIMTLIRLMKMVQPKLMTLNQRMLKRQIRVAQKMHPTATTAIKSKVQMTILKRSQPIIQMTLKINLHKITLKTSPRKIKQQQIKKQRNLLKMSILKINPPLHCLKLINPLLPRKTQ